MGDRAARDRRLDGVRRAAPAPTAGTWRARSTSQRGDWSRPPHAGQGKFLMRTVGGLCCTGGHEPTARRQRSRGASPSGSSSSCGCWSRPGAASFAAKLADVQNNEASSWLPESAESTRAFEKLEPFQDPNAIPTVVVYERDGRPDRGRPRRHRGARRRVRRDGRAWPRPRRDVRRRSSARPPPSRSASRPSRRTARSPRPR